MRKAIQNILKLPAHFWLIGVFPILYLYEQNFGLVIDEDVPPLIFWVLVATTIAFVAVHAASRNAYRAALITSCLSAFFSLSGHLHSVVSEREPLIVWTTTALIVMAIVAAELRKLRSERFFEQITLTLNLVSLALILMQIAAIFPEIAAKSSSQLSVRNGEAASAGASPSLKIHDSQELPDVYYIVPDAYPSDDWLLSAMGYDNSKFTAALKARGFEVVPHAQTNYPSTLVSVASTLNMRHFSTNPTELIDVDYLRHWIANSEVARYFLSLGYSYVQLLSGYLIPSPIADINRDFTPGGPVDIRIDANDLPFELHDYAPNPRSSADLRRFYQRSFVRLYFETTLLKPIADQLYRLLQRDKSVSYDIFAPERFLETIEELASIVELPEATFTLVHLLKPHSPTVFDKHGNLTGRIDFPSHREHLDELEFVNSKFIEVVDIILEGSRHQPVIIFQADHGSYFGRLRSTERRKIFFDVYSAYHLPNQYSLDIPRSFTNINTFPLVLNAVFDGKFAFKDNRLFELLAGAEDFAAQVDVTESFLRR